MRSIVFIAVLFIAGFSHAAAHKSDLIRVRGMKFPNEASEGTSPVGVYVNALRSLDRAQGFTELLPYTLRSPDQDEAGSCLYMSLTGLAEWWLAKLNPSLSRASDGPLDLSERYLMNVAGLEENESGVPNWKTDSIYLLNRTGGTLRNRDYRFTKGYWKTGLDGGYVQAKKGEPGAQYGPEFNWINDLGRVSHLPLVRLPEFKRDILFADPESNQWNTGVMPDDIGEQIKAALRKNKAPVQIIYNHYGYWHANFIVGYDDDADNKDCEFTREFLIYMKKRVIELREKAAKTQDPSERSKLLQQAERAEDAHEDTEGAFKRGGGCSGKGIFYVRDSIYGEAGEPMYDYDLTRKGDEAPYSKTTVLIEQDFVRTMGNHALQILPKLMHADAP